MAKRLVFSNVGGEQVEVSVEVSISNGTSDKSTQDSGGCGASENQILIDQVLKNDGSDVAVQKTTITVGQCKDQIAALKNVPRCLLTLSIGSRILDKEEEELEVSEALKPAGELQSADNLTDIDNQSESDNESDNGTNGTIASREVYYYAVFHSAEFDDVVSSSLPERHSDFWTAERAEVFAFQKVYERVGIPGVKTYSSLAFAPDCEPHSVKELRPSLLLAFRKWPMDNAQAVKATVLEGGHLLCLASERLKDSEKVVKAAISQEGYTLEFASERLKDSEEVVKAAVSRNGYTLQFASERLKDSEEVVKAAVSQDGFALGYASERFVNLWFSRV